jgi:hypothetical protein
MEKKVDKTLNFKIWSRLIKERRETTDEQGTADNWRERYRTKMNQMNLQTNKYRRRPEYRTWNSDEWR